MDLRKWAVAALAVLALAGCATVPQDAEERAVYDEAHDPLEPLNRQIFAINQVFDLFILKPVAGVYKNVMPDVFKDRVDSVLGNLGEPVVMANQLLQGEWACASVTARRFFVNSTIGLAGLADVAAAANLPAQQADFGETMHQWGAGEGMYLVLPFFGPSNVRDGIGLVVDRAMDPWTFLMVESQGVDFAERFALYRTGAQVVSRRAAIFDTLEQLEADSFDFYAQIRSVYRQHRNKQLGITANGQPSEAKPRLDTGAPGGL